MSAKQKDVGSAHDQKVFFRLCETFFRKFFKCLQRVPIHFFLFCKRMDVQKLPKAPFYFFRLYAAYRRPKKISKKFQKNRIFFQFLVGAFAF